jgi:FkbM family methyltransferase
MGIGNLLQEAQFILKSCTGWRGRLRLLTATVGFHLRNRLWPGNGSRRPTALLDVELRIGGERRLVFLRPRAGDLYILFEVLARGEYELPERILPRHRVSTIVDCGANIGLTALLLASRYPKARVIAIEADRGNFELLRRNCEGVERILPIHAAVVGSPRQTVRFSSDRLAWGNRVINDECQGGFAEISAITIPEVMQRYSIDRIDLLKLDIEGGEEDVFSSPSFLSSVDVVAIELHGDYGIDRFRSAFAGSVHRVFGKGELPGVQVVVAMPDGRLSSSPDSPSPSTG